RKSAPLEGSERPAETDVGKERGRDSGLGPDVDRRGPAGVHGKVVAREAHAVAVAPDVLAQRDVDRRPAQNEEPKARGGARHPGPAGLLQGVVREVAFLEGAGGGAVAEAVHV